MKSSDYFWFQIILKTIKVVNEEVITFNPFDPIDIAEK